MFANGPPKIHPRSTVAQISPVRPCVSAKDRTERNLNIDILLYGIEQSLSSFFQYSISPKFIEDSMFTVLQT